jgi:hypothetical protein
LPSVIVSSIQLVGMACRKRIGGVRGQRFAGSSIRRAEAWPGDEVAEVEAAAQRFEVFLGRRALDLRPVDFRQLVLRIGDAALGRAVIG